MSYLETELKTRCKLGDGCQALHVKKHCFGSLPSQQALATVQILQADRILREFRRTVLTRLAAFSSTTVPHKTHRQALHNVIHDFTNLDCDCRVQLLLILHIIEVD